MQNTTVLEHDEQAEWARRVARYHSLQDRRAGRLLGDFLGAWIGEGPGLDEWVRYRDAFSAEVRGVARTLGVLTSATQGEADRDGALVELAIKDDRVLVEAFVALAALVREMDAG